MLILVLFDHVASSITLVVMSIMALFFLIIFYRFAARVVFLVLDLWVWIFFMGFFKFILSLSLSLVRLTFEFIYCFSSLIFVIVVGDISVPPSPMICIITDSGGWSPSRWSGRCHFLRC